MQPRQHKRSRGLLPVLITLALSLCAAGQAFAQPGAPQRAEVKRAAMNQSALRPGDKAMLAVEVEVKEGFHTQSHTPSQEFYIKFELTPDKADAVTLGTPVYPKGHDEEYAGLGKLNVYTGTIVVFVPVEVKADAKPSDLKLTGVARYQACDDKVCYPPAKAKFEAKTSIVPAGTEVKPNEPDLFKDAPKDAAPAAAEPKKQADATVAPTTTPATAGTPPGAGTSSAAGAPPVVVESDTAGWGIGTALGVAFLAGILFNIVPCVLPVLPIKVLGFAEVAQHDRAKTLVLSTVFGLGIVSVFAVLSLFVLVLKTISWGQQFSNPIFAWGIVVLLLGLSLWLFGVLNVNLPTKAYAFTPRHDTMVGNFQWGVLTAILSTPCTGPMFVPVMGWATAQPKAIGVLAMMTVGVGMAFPYVVLSAFPEVARRFPRVGPWSELFKQMLGFILLAFTAYFAASQFTAGAGKYWAIIPVTAMAGLYLMARTVQISKNARPVAIASLLSVAMVTGTTMLALRFTELPTFAGTANAQDSAAASPSASSSVIWTPYSDDALEAARKANKLVLVKFTANWCLNCQYVEATVFHDQRAISSLRQHDVVTLKADLTEETAAGWPRLRELSSTGGIPLTAIYAPGYEKPVQITSVYTTATLVKTLDQLDASSKAVAVK